MEPLEMMAGLTTMVVAARSGGNARAYRTPVVMIGTATIMANAAQLTAYLAFADRRDRAARASQNTMATIAFCHSE